SRSATIEGRFQGTLTPEGDAARLAFSGQLRSTTLTARPGPPASFATRAFDWLPAAAVGVAILGGGVTVTILTRKRAAKPALRVVSAVERAAAKEYAERADEAAARDRWLEALDLLQAARRDD